MAITWLSSSLLLYIAKPMSPRILHEGSVYPRKKTCRRHPGGPWEFTNPPMHLIFFLAPALALLFFLLRLATRPALPPGPRGLPVVGNMLIMDQLTHRGLAKMAKTYGGLLHLRLGVLHAFAVSTPDVARQVLQTQDQAFSNRPATTTIRYLTYDCADMAFAHYSPFWRQMRKLCVVRLFSRRRATSWHSVRREVDAMVKVISAEHVGRPVNVGELAFRLTEKITLRAAFGSTLEEEHDFFIGVLQEFSRLFGAFNIGDFLPWLGWLDVHGIDGSMRKARDALDRFIDRIIDEHLLKPKDADDPNTDMVDDMIGFLEDSSSSRGGGGVEELQGTLKLTRDNIKAIIMDVMFGGTETVASAIEWTLSELLRSPSDLDAVQRELADAVGLDRNVCEGDLNKLPFLRCCTKEALRLHPPIPLLLHETASDCVLSGFSVPVRSRVMVNVWAINRDPSAWKDPDAFRPGRFASPAGEARAVDFKGGDFEFLPFGSGRRSCPGMQLGLHALELAVAQLLHCFEWELPGGMKPGELDMRDVFGLTAPRAVRLVAVPRSRRLTCEI